jgi:hypothetical protein
MFTHAGFLIDIGTKLLRFGIAWSGARFILMLGCGFKIQTSMQ